MNINFESRIRKIAQKDNPSYAVTIPKPKVKEGKLSMSKTYSVIITDQRDLLRAQSNVIEANTADINMLKRAIHSLNIAVAELGKENIIKGQSHSLGRR